MTLRLGQSTTFKDTFANTPDPVITDVTRRLDTTVTAELTEKGECNTDKRGTNHKYKKGEKDEGDQKKKRKKDD